MADAVPDCWPSGEPVSLPTPECRRPARPTRLMLLIHHELSRLPAQANYEQAQLDAAQLHKTHSAQPRQRVRSIRLQ